MDKIKLVKTISCVRDVVGGISCLGFSVILNIAHKRALEEQGKKKEETYDDIRNMALTEVVSIASLAAGVDFIADLIHQIKGGK